MTMSELPGDMVEEILCHVPAISLKRLRSTCKRWNLLFNDTRFARKHFDKAVRRQILILMLTKEFRVWSMNLNLHGVSSIDVTGEFSQIINSHPYLSEADISEVFHYDGLLLYTIKDGIRCVVWNPCTGQTKWIPPTHPNRTGGYIYALGSGSNNSYKILSYDCYIEKKKFAIYEIKSNSWRVLDITSDIYLVYIMFCVSLKGKTYWFAVDKKEKHHGVFLISFNYTTERFGCLCLPCHCPIDSYGTMALSLVREEKLSVLLQGENKSRIEIWVTNNIDETKGVSWSMALAVDYSKIAMPSALSFLVDEEKKFVVCCHLKRMVKDGKIHYGNMVHILEEDNKVTKVDFAASTMSSFWSFLFNYVPSLVQIQ